MFWLIQKVLNPYPRPRQVWIKVRFLHETEKAVLVLCDEAVPMHASIKEKITTAFFPKHVRDEIPKSHYPNSSNFKRWIPKSRIRKVKLRRSAFYLLIPEQLLLRADYTNYSKGQG